MIQYDPHEWRDHLCDIRGSMVREIVWRVLTCVLWSVVVVLAHKYVLAKFGVSLGIDPIAHSLIGVALGLLLVFRTNASYDRFWEGRRLWGGIVNECRNLARASAAYLASEPETLARLLHWTQAFPSACMNHLRGTKGLGQVEQLLPANEATAAANSTHPPLAVARRISEQLAAANRRGAISDYVMLSLDQNVQLLIDFVGGCDRIHNTPLPFAYVVHLRRALIMYCFSVPFALLNHFGWGTILATLLLAYTLYGIEEIGVEIADPFGYDDNDLPLEDICRRIETNVGEVLDGVRAGSKSM